MTDLLVADSFLVANGKTRGLALHRARFLASCAAAGVSADQFWDDQITRLPTVGRWFPRFELHTPNPTPAVDAPTATAADELSLQPRPTPPIGVDRELAQQLRPAPPAGAGDELVEQSRPAPSVDASGELASQLRPAPSVGPARESAEQLRPAASVGAGGELGERSRSAPVVGAGGELGERSRSVPSVGTGGELGEQLRLAPGVGAGGELAVQLRPAPPVGGRVRVAVYDGPDPRTAPRVKGPDLELLGKLRENAPHRADEILLLDSDGTVLEAAYSAIAWWEGDTLCFPPSDRPILPSVTAALLRQIAESQGVKVSEHPITPEALQSTDEAWLLNALHGIRPIHAWGPSPIDPLPNSPATTWQSHLEALSTPLP